MCTYDTEAATFVITDTKLYIPVVTLSTQDNTKLLQQLMSGFQRTIKWNKYQSKTIPIFILLNWSKFSMSKWTLSFIIVQIVQFYHSTEEYTQNNIFRL